MKKILIVILTVFLITINLLTLKIFNVNKSVNILYKDKLSLSFEDYITNINYDNFFKSLTDLSTRFNINIAQYIYTDENSLYVFSTNAKSDKSLSIIDGEYPTLKSHEYISNRFEDGSIGTLKFPSNELYLRIYDFNEIINWGLDKNFIISNVSNNNYENIIDEFEKFGAIEVNNQIPKIFYGYLFNDPSLIICVILSSIILLFFITYYLIICKKKISLSILLGLNKFEIICKTITPIAILTLCIDSILVSSILFYKYIEEKNIFFKEYTLTSIIVLIVVLAIILLYSAFICNIIINTIDIKSILRGKSEKPELNVLIQINKFFIFLAIIFVSVMLKNKYYLLNSKLENLQYWNKTQNIYKILISATANLDNLEIGRRQNDKLEHLYKTLELNKGAFLIDAENFTVLNDEYAYLHFQNEDDFKYGASGNSITIDKNYLIQNPITLYNTEESVDNLINYDSNVLNILVPNRYRSLEKEIISSYLDTFYFRKVTVDNLYREYMNLPLNTMKKDDLRINIIYTNDNQKYFTYSLEIGYIKDGNCIIDPIAMIYTDNIDSSFIYAWMTSSIYFTDTSNGKAYDNIVKYLKETDSQNIVQKFVLSTYMEVNKEIISLKNKINDLLFICLIFFIVILFFSLSYISIFYKNNSYKIYLKILLGYSIININLKIIFWTIVINSVTIILNIFINIKEVKLIILVGGLTSFFEILLIYIFSLYLNKQTINRIIKGEK